MAGTTRTILNDWVAAGVLSAINTARSSVSLSTLAAWQDQLPTLPNEEQDWEEWLRSVPTPFGMVVIGDETSEQNISTVIRKERTVVLHVTVSVTANDTFSLQQARADTEDSTVSGIETGLDGTYFGNKANRYPNANYEGSDYVPFETVRADLETGMLITHWTVMVGRDEGSG